MGQERINVCIRSRMVWAIKENEFIIRLNEIILDVWDNNNNTQYEVNLNQII